MGARLLGRWADRLTERVSGLVVNLIEYPIWFSQPCSMRFQPVGPQPRGWSVWSIRTAVLAWLVSALAASAIASRASRSAA